MDTKAKIKIIKKGSQTPIQKAKRKKTKSKSSQQTAREMVSTVSSWVNDFQKKRREETTEAFKMLFDAQANGCVNC